MNDYFDEIVGYEDIKRELRIISDMLNNPDIYRSYGVGTNKGLALIARNKGILALEEACVSISDEGMKKHLVKMMSFIVDGTEPSIIEEIFALRYFSNCFVVADALEYLVYMYGVLSMQTGDNPRIVEEKLVQFLSEEGEETYRKNAIQEQAHSRAQAIRVWKNNHNSHK